MTLTPSHVTLTVNGIEITRVRQVHRAHDISTTCRITIESIRSLTVANVLIISPNDDVAVALSDLSKGTPLSTDERALDIETQEAIPFGHKVALKPIKEHEEVIKYGASIGIATEQITPGEHVHTHNLQSVRGARDS